MTRDFLIIDSTSGMKLVCREADQSELRHYFALYRQEIFDKVDDFIGKAQVGDVLNIETYLVVVKWSGGYELFLSNRR